MRNRRVMGWTLAFLLATVLLGFVTILTQYTPLSRPGPPLPPPAPPHEKEQTTGNGEENGEQQLVVPSAPPHPVKTSAPRMPAFPWSPPPASAETLIPRKWFIATERTRLADVAERLELALNVAKYREWSYYSVPNGFALVSQMEQIKADGTPSPEPARWSTDLPWVANMTLLEFIKALANAQPGYYRVIVFIVINQPWRRTGKKPTGEEAERWLAEGFTWMPESISELPYGPDYRTTALVYEFKKVSRAASATFLLPSSTSADDHLKRASLYDPLGRR